MGNLCGKESTSLAPPGRVLGSAPALPTNEQVPIAARSKAKNPRTPKVTGLGRTLGGNVSSLGGGGTDREQSQSAPPDARAAAALAAEVGERFDCLGMHQTSKAKQVADVCSQ